MSNYLSQIVMRADPATAPFTPLMPEMGNSYVNGFVSEEIGNPFEENPSFRETTTPQTFDSPSVLSSPQLPIDRRKTEINPVSPSIQYSEEPKFPDYFSRHVSRFDSGSVPLSPDLPVQKTGSLFIPETKIDPPEVETRDQEKKNTPIVPDLGEKTVYLNEKETTTLKEKTIQEKTTFLKPVENKTEISRRVSQPLSILPAPVEKFTQLIPPESNPPIEKSTPAQPPRLVIGRITVEIVHPAPSVQTTPPAAQRPRTQAPSVPQSRNSIPGKLIFGLGQL